MLAYIPAPWILWVFRKGVQNVQRNSNFSNHWIALRENLNRKPMGFYMFLPSNIGLSCKFSHHPILWSNVFFCWRTPWGPNSAASWWPETPFVCWEPAPLVGDASARRSPPQKAPERSVRGTHWSIFRQQNCDFNIYFTGFDGRIWKSYGHVVDMLWTCCGHVHHSLLKIDKKG